MKKSIKVLAMFVILAGILAACNFPLFGGSDEDAVATSVAQTMEAIDKAVEPTVVVVQPTNTLPALPTITPQATNTVGVTIPTNTPLPCNKAQLVSENPVDDAVYEPGDTFTKTWRFKNIGTCTWNTNYKLVFVSGNAMGGTASKNLTSSVAPGETVDISVNLTAPSSSGTHKGVWNLQGDDGENYANFWVQIKVDEPFFAVTGVNLSAEHTNIEGSCPQTFNYQAAITTSGAGTVTYYFSYSDGSTGPTKSMTYSAAGTKTLAGSWELNATGSYWIKIYIDQPNHQWFGPLNLTLTCTP